MLNHLAVAQPARRIRAEEGDERIVRMLLDHGGVDVNKCDGHSRTPLWIASMLLDRTSQNLTARSYPAETTT